MNEKFKAGDKARIIKNTNHHGFNIGEIVVIKKCNHPEYTAESLDGHDYWYVISDNIEPLETGTIAINRYGNKVVAKMGKKVGVARCNETDTFELYIGVKIAVDRLFGKESEVNEVKEVKRHAKVGEYIKIVNTISCLYNEYKSGDILKVVERDDYSFSDGRAYYKNKSYKYASLNEYVVLENYKPHEVKEEPMEEKPKYYNGKVVCVDTHDIFLTVGKIYVFKDGLTKWDTGNQMPKSYQREPITSIDDLNEWISISSKFIELVEDK